MNDLINRQDAINAHCMCSCGKECDEYCKCEDIPLWFNVIPTTQPEKRYTKADYIMALHKEYGCDFVRAEKAHDKALEYLRDTAIIKG